MTVGSWSTMSTVNAWTECHSSSPIRNGKTTSWSGQDSVVKRRPKLTYKERLARFVRNPDRLPYHAGEFKVPINHAASAALGNNAENVFDRARSVRMRVAENLGEVLSTTGDYGAPHPFWKTWIVRREQTFPMTYLPSGNVYTGCVSTCGFEPSATPPAPWTSDHDYKLLERLREKIMGSDFNLASFLGAEGRDTVRFLGDTSQRLARSMSAFRRGNLRQSLDVLRSWGRYKTPSSSVQRARNNQQLDVYKQLAEDLTGRKRGQSWATVPPSGWLEWHLAAEPLLGDVVAAAQSLAHITQMPRKMKIKVGGTAKSSRGAVNGSVHWKVHTYRTKKDITAYFVYEPDPLAFLGFNDPEVTLWNAMPLTFVSDYMYNVGGFLEARATRAALPPGVYVISTKSDLIARNLVGSIREDGTYHILVDTATGPYLAYEQGWFDRVVTAFPDVPAPQLKPLGAFKSWQRALTTTSLAALIGSRAEISRFVRD